MNREQHTCICTPVILHACTHVCRYTCPETRICHFAPYLLPQPTPLHTQPQGERENVFLRVEYSRMSFATLTLHMQNLALCIHVERPKQALLLKMSFPCQQDSPDSHLPRTKCSHSYWHKVASPK